MVRTSPGPASDAWLAQDFSDLLEHTLPLPGDAVLDLQEVMRQARMPGSHMLSQDPGTFRAPSLEQFAAHLRERMKRPAGFVIITGFPVEHRSIEQIESAYWALGLHLGQPVSQSKRGDFIGHVADKGSDISDHNQRGYQSAAELTFHADRTDLISLLCVRHARVGGLSRVVSTAAIHNIMLDEHPELLQELYQPVPVDRRGEELPGESPWCMMPVFASLEGRLITRYIRRFILGSQRWSSAPRLRPEQIAAMDCLDEILERPGVALTMHLQPGDVQLVDNFRLLHSRTAFSDDGALQGRFLLRLWLASADSPQLPGAYAPLYGSVTAGSYRGGVWPGAGWPDTIGLPVKSFT